MPTTFNVRDYGAVGDGATNDANAIQAAIEACTAHGGGSVLIPAGATYLSGSLVLKSHVDLHVERGATLQGSGSWADITERSTVSALSSGVVTDQTQESGQFLAAYGETDISISGGGVIDGGGRHYVLEDLGPIYRMPNNRPFALFFLNCREVSLTDVLFRDAALWTVRLTGCENVLIHAIRIQGDLRLPNADGIDLDHCRNVRISDCNISCPDDAISLKTCEEFPDAGPCENITVTNCVLETRSSALVVGVDARDPIRNVVFDNCVIKTSHRGLSVNMGQGSHYENILFSNIIVETQLFDEAWWGRGEAIYVSAMPWHDEVGTIKNVRFVNILARGENGVYIEGSHPGLIDNIVLQDVRMEIDRWSDLPAGRYDRRPYSGPEPIYQHPTAAFFVANASNVTLRNCEAVWGPTIHPHYGAAVETSGVDGFVLDNFSGDSAFPGTIPAILQH